MCSCRHSCPELAKAGGVQILTFSSLMPEAMPEPPEPLFVSSVVESLATCTKAEGRDTESCVAGHCQALKTLLSSDMRVPSEGPMPAMQSVMTAACSLHLQQSN